MGRDRVLVEKAEVQVFWASKGDQERKGAITGEGERGQGGRER